MNHNLHCLLIDDDEDDQEIFCLALSLTDKSIYCEVVNSGALALEKLQTDHTFIPYFIFIDMNMPGMNGMKCMTEIKTIRRLASVPVYLYSTSADPAIMDRSKQLGAADFFVKPSSISHLSELLDQLISKQIAGGL